MNKDANYWIDKLRLQEHPEGGYFIETYKSQRIVILTIMTEIVAYAQQSIIYYREINFPHSIE